MRSPETEIIVDYDTYQIGSNNNVSNALKAEFLTFSNYIPKAWPIIEPSTRLMMNWHIDCIAEHLEAVMVGQIQNLVINLPPRNLKSDIVSVLWPTWAWTERAWLQFIFISYAQHLSDKFSRDRRQLIESQWYRDRWGNMVQLADDQNQKKEFANTARGSMFATSVGGTLTGKGADIIVIDDGINPEEAESKAEREASIRFIKNTVSTRLNDKKRGAIIEISQRTHKHDISGTLLAEGTYVHLKLPAEAIEKQVITFPMSGRIITRNPGDLLHGEREDKAVLKKLRGGMTERAYRAQVQQSPASEEGNFIKRQWFRYWSKATLPVSAWSEMIQSWDLSFKDSKDSSYVVGQVWARYGLDFFLLDQVREQMNFPDTKRAFRMMTEKWPDAYAKLVEDKANGPAILDDLKSEITGLIAIEPDGSKEARLAAQSHFIESGHVYLPEPSLVPWVDGYIEELCEFPEGDFDDQVDATSQALRRFHKAPRPAAAMGGVPMSNGNGNGHQKADWMRRW